MNNKIFLFTLLLLVATLSFGQEGMSEDQSKFYSLGFGIPRSTLPSIDFTLPDLEGEEVTLSDLKGKIVFLNFWATWCGPCRSEMPSMESLYGILGDRNFEMLAVASLRGDSMESITDFVERNSLSFPVLIDAEGGLGSQYSVEGIPTTYIIGKDGNIIARLVGAYYWSNTQTVDLLTSLTGR